MVDSNESVSEETKTYHGIAHVHSTFSHDGSLELVELRSLCIRQGLSFALMSEHTDQLTPERAREFVEACREHSDHTFVFIPGFEVPYRDAHVLMYGCDHFISQTADRATLKDWKDCATTVVLAHPHRNHFEVDETLKSVLDGVEIWNSKYDGKYAPRPRAWRLFDELHSGSADLIATAGLDVHRVEHMGGPELSIELSELSQDGVRHAFSLGKFVIDRDGVCITSRQESVTQSTWSGITSWLSITFLTSSQRTTKFLDQHGIGVPTGLKRMIRQYF